MLSPDRKLNSQLITTGYVRRSSTQFYFCWNFLKHLDENIVHKKVLLRERKRHTDRRVARTRSAVPVGVPPAWNLTWTWEGGTPHLDLGRRYPHLDLGRKYPHLDLGRGYPPPGPGKEVPPPGPGKEVPPLGPRKGVPPTWTLEGGSPLPAPGKGYVNRQTPVKTVP